ncbi:MAG: 30S ribosomal protein S20 [Ruminococcaceae bacterium]|jgi:small subunit ribosomal protein S20|nr:30S ribosomal protein S20 [Oscillospiraceae bacterium]
MPNIKSAIKRTRIIAKKTAANKMQKSKIRTLLKKTSSAVASSAENAEALVRQSQTALDKAAAKGLMHKNNVARQKSHLAKVLKSSAQ